MTEESKNIVKFSGLSTPEELKKTWKNLIWKNVPDLNIIFEYTNPNQLKKQYNIINVCYRYKGNATGHYVSIFLTDKYIIYFDPLKGIPDKNLVKDLESFNLPIYISKDGEQKINGNSCGFHCLTFLYNLYRHKEINLMSVEDLIKLRDRIIKLNQLITCDNFMN